MACPRCGAPAENGKNFCGDCGSPLHLECKACGAENPAGKRFCADCGTPLQPKSSAPRQSAAQDHRQPAAERRQLTVMFVDLVGSTLLGARLDPEDLRDVIVAYQNCIKSIVTSHDGFIARYMGDGALVYFGYPRSQEDDAERAIQAGLAMVEAVANLSTSAGPAGTLACRVGIATGPVVIGDVIGFGSSLESPVVGDTPNLAAGIVAMANPGTVAIADTTHRLTGGLFECCALQATQLKGRTDPIHAWAVVGEKQVDSRFEALRTSNLPLVGRSEELRLLMRRWEQAKSGEGRVVLLIGEAGIGKSRLAASLVRKVKQDPHGQVRLVCSPTHRDSPLYPIIRQVERAAKFERGDPPDVKLEKLAQLLEADSPSNPDVILFADLLSIPREHNGADTPASNRSKAATLSGILRQFDRLARQNPVLVVFEDIHWADPTSLDLLDLLIETVEHLPILVVITTRPERQLSWVSRPQVTVQSLSGLDRRHAASLIKAISRQRELPKDIVDSIVARADGIPLFIEELTKTVLELQPQLLDERQDALSAPASDSIVPSTLQASLMARLDRLVAAKEVAQLGSVVGREFSFELLQGLSGLPQKDLEVALNELVQTGLATAHGQPPEATYIFKHALVQDAAYASLLRERRRAIHLDLAKLLEGDGARGQDVLPEVVAWHWSEAGVPERSIDCYLGAAHDVTGRFALKERVSHLRKALRQIQRLPASTDTTRRELSVQVALYHALVDEQGSGSEDVLATVERARSLCLALNDTQELIRIQDGLFNYHFSHSQPGMLMRYADEMRDVGQRTGNPQAFIMARKMAGFANLLLGHFGPACEEMRLLVETYDGARDGHASLAVRDPKMGAYTVLGICLTALGFVDSGAAKSLEAVRHADTLNHSVSQIVALRRACVQGMMQRDTQSVLTLSERLLGLATEFETFKGARDGTIFNCWAKLQMKHDPALMQRMRDCIENFDATEYWALLPFFMTVAADLMAKYGDGDGAASLLNRAAELSRSTGESWCEPEIIRMQAGLTRDFDHSVSLLHSSLDKAGRQNAKLWELRTATSLADVLLKRGDRGAARDALAPVHAWFTEGHNTADVLAARTLLTRIEGGGESPSMLRH